MNKNIQKRLFVQKVIFNYRLQNHQSENIHEQKLEFLIVSIIVPNKCYTNNNAEVYKGEKCKKP